MSKAKAVSTNRVKKSREDWIFDIILYTIGVLLIIITLYPMYFIVIASFSDPAAVSNGQIMFLPKGINFKGYKQLASYAKLWTGYRNTIAYVIMGTLVTLVVNIPASYALSRKHLYGRKFFTAFYLIPMFFTGGLIPTYLVIQKLQMLNTIWALILPGCLSVYNMIVARTFFKSNISEELYEAAEIDGCTQARFFFQIALPLSKAIIAILVLYYGVGHWNSYFSALVYISDKAKYPLQLVLRNILITNQTALSQTATTAAARAALQEKQQLIDVMKYSLIIISSIPVLVMYPLVQKHFVKGVMIGSMKG